MTKREELAALWDSSTNLRAFAHALKFGEGTLCADGYRVMFGGARFCGKDGVLDTFDDFADHPRRAVTRKLRKGGVLTSTAAGAYQFLQRTWDDLVEMYGFEDFSPRNQDLGCVALIARRGALADVLAGRIEEAVRKCNREWASLPESPYGQPTVTMDEFMAHFEDGLASDYLRKEEPKFQNVINYMGGRELPIELGKVYAGTEHQVVAAFPLQTSNDLKFEPKIEKPGVLDLVKVGAALLKPGGLRNRASIAILLTTAVAAAVHFGAKHGYDLSWVDKDLVIEICGAIATLIVMYTSAGSSAPAKPTPDVPTVGGVDRNTEDTMRAGG